MTAIRAVPKAFSRRKPVARFPDDIDDKYRPISDEERRLKAQFLTALSYQWKEYDMEGPDGSTVRARKMWLTAPHAATRFFEQVIGLGDRGYDLAAIIIAKEMDHVERPVRSNLMTRMARAIPDCIMRSPHVREREISQFGQVIHRLVQDFPQRFLEWVEDMNADDPWNDLKEQPTAIIRGALLAASIDATRMAAFWGLAAASARFPDRMFSDPAEAAEDGSPFTAFHLRRYADMFAVMSDEAILRFGTRMRTMATHRLAYAFAEDKTRSVVSVRLAKHERVEMLRRVLNGIDDPRRREVARRALLNAPPPPP
jgi:hypothetical protein